MTGKPPSFVCPRCGAESFNTHDIVYRYCGRCHVFVDDSPPRAPTPAIIRQQLLDEYGSEPIATAANRRLLRNLCRLLVEGDARLAGVPVDAALKAYDARMARAAAKDRKLGFTTDDDLSPPTAAERAEARKCVATIAVALRRAVSHDR
jgi:hypothetical protein